MARILITLAGRLVRGPDGHVYAPTSTLALPFWTRYRAVFDEVGVACRVMPADTVPASMLRADGDGVSFHDLPAFVGPWQYVAARRRVIEILRDVLDGYDAYCLRVPCWIGTLAYSELRRRCKVFGIEVVGDPWDSLAPGAVKSLTRPFVRRSARRELRRQCRDACAASYVTKEALQRSYPPGPGTFVTHYSSIDLGSEAFAEAPRTECSNAHRLIFVGTLEVLYKGQDVLIQALAQCQRADIKLSVVGDGRCREDLRSLAKSLGLAHRIEFTGMLPSSQDVRAALDNADLFVLPSRQEGLPRAMIEAMARGLPCIGSTVGGILELLPAEDTVEAGDVAGLARKIAEYLGDAERMARSSARNLQTARQYHADILNDRRRSFLHQLRRRSETAAIEEWECPS